MKRIMMAAVPFLAASLLVVSPAAATRRESTCHKVKAELASGKSESDVAKDLKISKSAVDHCVAKKMASAKPHSKSGSTSSSSATSGN
jgi:hypothetical protein